MVSIHFVADFSKKCKRKVTGISGEARWSLQAYEWPGNVRELENAIERALVLGSTDLIVLEDLPEVVRESGPGEHADKATLNYAIKEAKRQLIREALQRTGGNYTEAAKRLGIHSNNLHRLIRSLAIKTSDPE